MAQLPTQPTPDTSLFIRDFTKLCCDSGSCQIADDTKYALSTGAHTVHMTDPLAHLPQQQRLDWLLTHGCKNHVIHTNDEVARYVTAKIKQEREEKRRALEFLERVESWEKETYFIQWKRHMLWRTSSSEREFNARIAQGKVHHFEFTEYDNGCTEPYMRCFYVCDNNSNVYAFDGVANPWRFVRNKSWAEGTPYPAFTVTAEENQYQLRFRRK